FFQAEDGIRDFHVTGVQTCALPISLVTALVVLPTASRASVVLRTSLSMLLISAMPPALSVTGPKASRATTTPASASMVVTAMAKIGRASCRERGEVEVGVGGAKITG